MAAPIGIQTNVASLKAQGNLAISSRNLNQSIQRLSSGVRVNSAADDAAGIAISEGLNAQVRGFQQAQRNTNDAVAMLQTAEGSYQTISDILTRMRELAVQSANASLGSNERGYVEAEYAALGAEITRIAGATEYNGISLLAGDGGGGATTLTFQIGTRNAPATDQLDVDFAAMDAAALFTDSGGLIGDVTDQANAQTAITSIDAATVILAGARADVGSNINKLTAAGDNLGSTIENLSAARSQIRDADVTAESANFTKNQVLMQAGVSMLAQANAQPNLALRLLG